MSKGSPRNYVPAIVWNIQKNAKGIGCVYFVVLDTDSIYYTMLNEQYKLWSEKMSYFKEGKDKELGSRGITMKEIIFFIF